MTRTFGICLRLLHSPVLPAHLRIIRAGLVATCFARLIDFGNASADF